MPKKTFQTEFPNVTVLGGANVDITGFPSRKLLLHDANPGSLSYCMGGVGRNIAENLVRLGVETNLISVIGDDIHGKNIVEHCNEVGIEIKDCLYLKNQGSSVHMAIMNESNDLAVAISAMEIYNRLAIDFIKTKLDVIQKSNLTVIETNISEDVIQYVIENVPNHQFCLDAVSSAKAERVKNHLHHFYIIKANLMEAEVLSEIKINSESDYKKATDYFHEKGVQKVFITLGEKGVYYSDGQQQGLIKSFKNKLVNTNGAGDAFMSGIIDSELKGLSIEEATNFGLACSSIAVAHQETVNPNMSLDAVERVLKH